MHFLKLYVPPLPVLSPADAIVVLGNPANPDGTLGPALREKVELAVDLYKSNYAPALILTGGAVRNRFIEAEVMAAHAKSLGIRPAAIHIEPQSRDTIENARFTRVILDANGYRKIILVTTPFHMRRASGIFNRHGIPHQIAYHPNSVQFQTGYNRPKTLFYELMGYLWGILSPLLKITPFWSQSRP